ncbi:MAG: hypothetical protein ACE5D7_10815, partial [Fidelibacterota bacterium]
RMIGTGIISGDIKYDQKYVEFKLLDFWGRYDKEIPANLVNTTDHANAPAKNIGKPLPMSYGDFHDKTGIGTIPTSGAEFDRYFTRSKFPAIITDKWDDANAYVEATADNETLDTLDTKNVYLYNNDYFAACEDTNVGIGSNPTITFSGSNWRSYIQLEKTGSGSQSADNDFSTSDSLTTNAGNSYLATLNLGVPKIPSLGDFTDIYLMIDYGSKTGTIGVLDTWQVDAGGGAINLDKNAADETVDISALWTSPSNWDLEKTLTLTLDTSNSTNDVTLPINEIGIEVQFKPQMTFAKNVRWTTTVKLSQSRGRYGRETVYKKVYHNKDFFTPEVGDYIYYSGKGRKYFSAIDSGGRSNGYASDGTTDPIENPIYQIEDVIRTELGQTNIDQTSFDNSGNTTNGYIGDIFNDAVSDVIFSFCIYEPNTLKGFLNNMAKQILSWVWVSGDGNFKIATLRRPTDYSSKDKTINYNDIILKDIIMTPLNSVRNDITVDYEYDYGVNETLSQVNTTDATSAGTTASGYNQTLELKLEAPYILDSTTATQLADAYLTIFKDRKNIIKFDCLRPKYLDLEIGDIIQFSNWDTNVKLYGTALNESNDY